jgi:hypothetical protein
LNKVQARLFLMEIGRKFLFNGEIFVKNTFENLQTDKNLPFVKGNVPLFSLPKRKKFQRKNL